MTTRTGGRGRQLVGALSSDFSIYIPFTVLKPGKVTMSIDSEDCFTLSNEITMSLNNRIV